jgi:hypothetical protein
MARSQTEFSPRVFWLQFRIHSPLSVVTVRPGSDTEKVTATVQNAWTVTLKELHGYIQESWSSQEREDECFKLRRSSACKEEAVIYTSKDGAALHKWLMAAPEALTA